MKMFDLDLSDLTKVLLYLCRILLNQLYYYIMEVNIIKFQTIIMILHINIYVYIIITTISIDTQHSRIYYNIKWKLYNSVFNQK